MTKQNANLATINLADVTDIDQLKIELNILANDSKDLIAKAQNYPNPDNDPGVTDAKLALRDEVKMINAFANALLLSLP